MIQQPKDFNFKLTSDDIESIRSLLADERWQAMQRLLDAGAYELMYTAAASAKADTWFERGLWRGWLLVGQRIAATVAEGQTQEPDEEAIVDALSSGGEARGGYDMDV